MKRRRSNPKVLKKSHTLEYALDIVSDYSEKEEQITMLSEEQSAYGNKEVEKKKYDA